MYLCYIVAMFIHQRLDIDKIQNKIFCFISKCLTFRYSFDTQRFKMSQAIDLLSAYILAIDRPKHKLVSLKLYSIIHDTSGYVYDNANKKWIQMARWRELSITNQV